MEECAGGVLISKPLRGGKWAVFRNRPELSLIVYQASASAVGHCFKEIYCSDPACVALLVMDRGVLACGAEVGGWGEALLDRILSGYLGTLVLYSMLCARQLGK